MKTSYKNIMNKFQNLWLVGSRMTKVRTRHWKIKCATCFNLNTDSVQIKSTVFVSLVSFCIWNLLVGWERINPLLASSNTCCTPALAWDLGQWKLTTHLRSEHESRLDHKKGYLVLAALFEEHCKHIFIVSLIDFQGSFVFFKKNLNFMQQEQNIKILISTLLVHFNECNNMWTKFKFSLAQ